MKRDINRLNNVCYTSKYMYRTHADKQILKHSFALSTSNVCKYN